MIRLAHPALISLFIPLGLVLAAATQVTATETPLGAYAGKFSGKGTLRREPDEPRETVRCRISSDLSSDGLSLVQSGTCVVPGSKVAIDSKLTFTPATGRVTGTWTDVANGTAANVSGQGDNSGFNLTIVGTDRQTGEIQTFWMTLTPNASGYSLTTRSLDPAGGGRFVSGEINFTK